VCVRSVVTCCLPPPGVGLVPLCLGNACRSTADKPPGDQSTLGDSSSGGLGRRLRRISDLSPFASRVASARRRRETSVSEVLRGSRHRRIIDSGSMVPGRVSSSAGASIESTAISNEPVIPRDNAEFAWKVERVKAIQVGRGATARSPGRSDVSWRFLQSQNHLRGINGDNILRGRSRQLGRRL